jgi:ParB family transcriptional regulator, chromosome partitioning protein
MNTITPTTDSAASTTSAPVESTDAKPSKKGKAGKKAARAEAPRTGKKTKAPRAAKAKRAPRKGRKVAAAESTSAAAGVAEPLPREPLPMEEVYPNPNQPRKLFTRADLEELAASIKEAGRLIQPITVVKRVRPDGKGKYMIVCGERRFRAHQILGWATIDANVVDMTDDQVADAAIIENLQRKDITPLEEARAYQARLDTGLTVEQLAQRLGLKQSWRVTERTSLLKLTAENQEAFARGALTPSQAYEMSQLRPAMQRVLFNAIAGGKCKTYAELRKTAQALALRDQQTEIPINAPGVAPPTETERERVREVEGMIDKVCELVQKGFEGNDVVILRKVNPVNADVLADKLDLIEASLRKLRLELRAAAVTRSLEQAAPAEPTVEQEEAAPAIEQPSEVPAETIVVLDSEELVDIAADQEVVEAA